MRPLACVVSAIVLLLIGFYFYECWHMFGPSSRYLIPAGYVGRIQVEYEIPCAAALTMEEGRYLIRISPDGRAQTSSKLPEGWHEPEDFYYVSGKSRKRLPEENGYYPPPAPMVRGGTVGSGSNMPVTEFWFIGTDKQFNDYKKKHGADSEWYQP